jgi:hypothetical protein
MYARERNLVSHIHTGKNIQVYENMVPMKIFAAKRAGVKGRWRKVDNEKLDNLYSLSNIRHSTLTIQLTPYSGNNNDL